jgi:oxygen-independent coproporphyrinogen-3 oxidase
MSAIILRGNTGLFATDLRQLGHVFFPGEEITVITPAAINEEPGAPTDAVDVVDAVADTDAAGAEWLIACEALPQDDGYCWHVAVRARGPQAEKAAEGKLHREPLESPRTFEHRLRRLMQGLLVDVLSDLRGFHPGWGILTGVRPTKLVHQMLDQGVADAKERLMHEYRVTEEKAGLVTGVAKLQRPYLNQDPRAISIYVGIPFCPSICSFCSFSIYPILEHKGQVPAFLEALGREMEIVGEAIRELGLRVETIYFGGGTPTSPKDEDFAWMLQKCADTILKGQQPVEYTVEAGRPETFTRAKLDAMAYHGVNRVSVNPQTTVQATLMHLGRIHTVEKFYRAYDLVRQHAHPFIINCDTIIGLPGEGPDEVTHTLNDMQRLAPDNLTVHTLAIKRGSRLHREGAAAMEALRAMTPQEAEALVRQDCTPGKESLYNIQMMEERQTIIGLGGGATCKWYKPLGDYRGWLLRAPDNPNEPGAYISRAEELAQQKVAELRLLYDPASVHV